MEFGILGSVVMIDKGQPIPLGSSKLRGMLAVLLYYAGESVRADTLIELLWGSRGKMDHRPALQAFADRLRGVLARAGRENSLVRVVGSDAFRLDIDPAEVDFHRFRRLLADARGADEEGNPESAADILVRALALSRGDPLTELRGPYAEQLRLWVHESLFEARKLLAGSWLACGRHHSALAELEPLIRDHGYGLDEGLARSWIRALRAVGRAPEARRFAGTFRRRFQEEMRADPELDVAPPATVPRRLPPDIADFTGREALLRELDGLRRPGRHPSNVIVLTGMPGVGKTTLATHWAHRQRRHFPDGQLFLDAAAYGPATPVDPYDAIDRFLRALGVPPDQLAVPMEQRRDRFQDVIGERRILLVIDNVLNPDQVRPLIPRSMNCLTIITSRVRLSGLSIREGCRTVTVPPLAEAESTALLARIIGSRGTDDAAGLASLAKLSTGHPLAARIIGEHVAERPRASIGELVGDLRENLLHATDDDDRTASLATVFDWSYRALRRDAADLFRRISLHPGEAVSSEAAAALAGAAVPDVETLLNVLAKAHMINHDTAHRYRFHDLLHRFASERAAVEGDDPERAERRLLDWYLLSAANAVEMIAPEWPAMPDLPNTTEVQPKTFPSEAEAMRWCDAERDNLREVSRWAEQLGYYRHGWQIPGVVHEILERYGCPGEIVKLNQQAMSAARRDGHEIGQIGTLVNLGTSCFAMHHYDQAIATFQAAMQFAEETGNLEEATICLHNLAATHLSLGDFPKAIEMYDEALLAFRKSGNAALEAAALYWIAQAYLRMGYHEQSARTCLEALAIRERIGAKRGVGQCHGGLGEIYLVSGRLRPALRHCEIALAIHVDAHDQMAECDTVITLTEVRRGLGLHAEAVPDGWRAVRLAERIADSYRQVQALTVLGEALVAAGDPVSAAHQVRTARRILDDLSNVHPGPLHERLLAVEQTLRYAPPESRAG